MLTAAVDSLERLFVQQAGESVPLGDLLHRFHGQLVVVGAHVGIGKHRRQLMLRGCHLVVLGLGKDTQLPQLAVEICHKRGHARLDGAEIMILQLLPLGRSGAEQRASAEHQVLPLPVQLFVHQKIFLLRADRRAHAGDLGIAEQPQNPQRLLIDDLH